LGWGGLWLGVFWLIFKKGANMSERTLYRTKFGSHLYGTSTPDSDTDYKSIFLPSLDNLILADLGDKCRSRTLRRGDDNEKNDKNDVDDESWSLQYWLSLVRAGDTGALDVLYSYSYPGMVEFCDDRMKPLFQNPLHLFNPLACKAYVGYCVGQAKKYGIKGSRLGVIKRVYEHVLSLQKHPGWNQATLYDVLPGLLQKHYEPSYCFTKTLEVQTKPIESLVLCGKVHQGNITLQEFYNRVKSEYERYGERARLAEQNKGLDWKALSHAVRCIFQMVDLLKFGRIKFPLKKAPAIMAVKKGEKSWDEVSRFIDNGLEEIERLQTESRVKGKYDKVFVKQIVKWCYRSDLA
jgi:hypothetical protein